MSKRNIIALILFVVALGFVFTLKTPQTIAFQSWVMGMLSPFMRGSAAVEHEVKDLMSKPVDAAQLLKERDSLKQQVDGLIIIEKEYQKVLEENNKFRSMLNYRQETPFKLTAARVLRRSASNWWTTIIIDKGAFDGLGTDSPVITDIGLVGKTGKVAAHTAEVVLLMDEECRVAARIEGTQSRGILSGERGGFESKPKPDLRLRFLDRTVTVLPGANVFSTGDGGVFPAGLLLGKVKVFEARDVSGEAVVESAVDFSLMEDVFVVHMDSAAAP